MEATEQQHEEKAHELKPQLVGGLTDTVFGVAITLLATSLSINTNSSSSQILQQFGGFAASFLIIAIIWLRRFQLLRWMRIEPAAFTRLNFALLALVVSYTYVLRLFTFSSTKSTGEFAFFLFALLSGLVWGVMAGLAQVALHAEAIMSRYRRQAIRLRNALLLTCVGFFVAAGLVFVSLQIASFAMIAAFSVGRLYRLFLERRQRRQERKSERKHGEAHEERKGAIEQSASQIHLQARAESTVSKGRLRRMEMLLSQTRAILSIAAARWQRLTETVPADLLTRPPLPGEWSAAECLQHVLDTERSVFPVRVRALLAGQDFPAFNPDKDGTDYSSQTPAQLAAAFASTRAESLALLEQVTAQDLPRTARHSQLGLMSLEETLHAWVAHDLMHMVQAERALMQPFVAGSGALRFRFKDHDVGAV